MRKGFAAILVLGLVVAVFVLGGAYLLKQKSAHTTQSSSIPQHSQTEDSSFPNEIKSPNQNQECRYSNGTFDKDFYLDTYVVQSGDTLLKVAQNQMGNSARIDELIEINKTWYPDLAIDNSQIKTGSKLRIPPKFFPKSSGDLEGFGGKIAKVGDNWMVVYLDPSNRTDPSDQAGWISYKTQETKYLGKDSFNVGDCVNVVRSLNFSVGDQTYLVLAISPQDKNYFKDIPTGDVKTGSKIGKCQYYGYLDKDFFLTLYTAKKGDSISSVATKELGDESRTNELIYLNKTRYSYLSRETPFLEIGWQLWLPPKFIPKSPGVLAGMGGEIIQETNESITLDLHLTHPDYDSANAKWENVQYVVYKDSQTKHFGKDSFAVGDCVYLIKSYTEKRGSVSYDIAAISPQDKNYFK